MKVRLLIIIFFSTFLITKGQNAINKSKDFIAINNIEGKKVYISEKPITNRDYLTYLVWLNYASRNYTKPIIDAFPSLDYESLNDSHKSKLVDFETRLIELIRLTDPIVGEYMFNINYIDYPLIGVTERQLDNFCIWLTDRYNEFKAIKKGDLDFDPNQYDDECFSTESYLCNMYTGLVKRKYKTQSDPTEYKIKWEDQLFIPKFRPPSYYELSNIETKTQLKEYKYFDFLKVWIKHYMEIDKNGVTLKMGGLPVLENYFVDKKFKLPEVSNYHVDLPKAYRIENHILNSKIVCSSQEDSLGHLPYSIIGEDESGNPIFIKRTETSNEYKYPYLFRVVTNVNK